jgi:hypothetical protein
MSEELKPCPFCGGEASLRKQGWIKVHPRTGKSEDLYTVACDTEGCNAKYAMWSDTPQEARAAWNCRADGWISVDEGLPEEADYYIVTNGKEVRSAFYWECDTTFDEEETEELKGGVTHWMPLPAPPALTPPPRTI